MKNFILLIFAAVILSCSAAESMKLEEFMANLAKSGSESANEDQESAPLSDDQLSQFMKRSGLIQPSVDSQNMNREQMIASALQALQSLNPQSSPFLLAPQYSAQTSSAATAQQPLPKTVQPGQTATAYASQQKGLLWDDDKSAQMQSYQQPSRPYSPSASASSSLPTVQSQQPVYLSQGQQQLYSQYMQASNIGSDKTQTSADKDPSSSKGVLKQDRQGPYAYEHGYEPAAYDHQETQYRNPGVYNQGGYGGGGYSKPSAAVAIKLDPLGLLKLLLSGLPKPLLNLNGKVFFGVELGNNLGIAKGIGKGGYAGQGGYGSSGGYNNGGTVISLG
ncbi:uncharacterized protein [Parasteatoda tepidariorum]|uniref:uncharacterized protein n=1 Tax=Parasteatoda tepidariorum TaxID=114398 RepID=UPI00077FE3A6|nr:uncharacterized protein LOC107441400 [Parasteatoda tepidariorum]